MMPFTAFRTLSTLNPGSQTVLPPPPYSKLGLLSSRRVGTGPRHAGVVGDLGVVLRVF